MPRFLAIVYRLPAEPSGPRVAIWRALKKLDGAYLQGGVFVVRSNPLASATLRSLAHDVRNFGGDATVLDIDRIENERAVLASLKLAADVRARRASRPKRSR
ncbi:MAG: Chromate resistance protein ChrB [Thermoplasmatota archaeon]